MIKSEIYTTREDGVVLIRTYSDAGFKIERDGARYDEAIDPEEMHREYVETDEVVGTSMDDELPPEEALAIIMGGHAV